MTPEDQKMVDMAVHLFRHEDRLRPIREDYLVIKDGFWCGCALTAIAMAKKGWTADQLDEYVDEEHGERRDEYVSLNIEDILPKLLEISETRADGIICGFDGSPPQKRVEQKEFDAGFDIGTAIWKQIKDRAVPRI